MRAHSNVLRSFAYVVAALLMVLQMGCASSGAAGNRSRDLGDIFTCTLGGGSGVKVRVGTVQLAVINHQDLVGLRAGCGFAGGDGLLRNEDTYRLIPKPAKPNWNDEAVQDVFRKGKGSVYDMRGKDTLVHIPMYQSRWYSAFGHELFDPGPEYSAVKRRKEIAVRSPVPCYTVLMKENPAYYTQIEAALGLGLTIRLGFNPGELVDFLGGFLSMDLYGDDL